MKATYKTKFFHTTQVYNPQDNFLQHLQLKDNKSHNKIHSDDVH